MRPLDNLPFRSRLAILATIFIIPLLVILWFFVDERIAVIAAAQAELRGIAYLGSVDAVLADLGQSPTGGNPLPADLMRLRYENDKHGKALKVNDLVGALLRQPPGPSTADRLRAATLLVDVISRVDDTCGLSLDPRGRTYYLVEMVLVRLPRMVLQGLAFRALAEQPPHGSRPDDMRAQLAFSAGRFDTIVGSFSVNVDKATAAIQDRTIVMNLRAARNRILLANAGLTHAAFRADQALTEAAVDRASQAAASAFEVAGEALQTLLAARVDEERDLLFSRLTVVIFLVFAGGVFAVVTTRSITGPVRAMTRAMTSLASGDATLDPLPQSRRDEVGQMAETLHVLREKLIEGDWAKIERKDAIDALSKSVAAFRLPFEANPLPMWVYERGTLRFLDANLATIEQYGWTHDQLLKMTVLDAVPAEERDRALSATLRRPLTGRKNAGLWTHLRADGSRILVEVFTHPIAFEGRDAVLVAAIDVTETKRLEEQLAQARKMEAVGQLAGGIAHDFNNLLGAILGFAGFLVEDLPAGTSGHRFASRIVAAGERARDLVKQILAFSPSVSGDLLPTVFGGIVLAPTDLLRTSAPSSTALTIIEETDRLIANVNATHISQIIMNLCLNANDAIKSMPGRVAITLSRLAPGQALTTVPDPLDLLSGDEGARENYVESGSIDPSRSYAVISVADSGTGMTQAQLQRIFEPFFTTKTRGQGTGLGLSIVHTIISQYQGVCHVLSRPGHGSLFRIYIPLTDDAVRSAEQLPAKLGGLERIMVVDDETMMTEMLEIGLNRLGYAVTTFNAPIEALKAYALAPADWDIVISDQVMPDLKGNLLFQEMKAINPELRFILCTGFSDTMTKSAALAAGIDAFFHKPVSADALAETMRQLLEWKAAGQKRVSF